MDTSAQASTDIKKALQETVKLEDGRHGYIFTELPPIGLLSRWHCHICGRTISSERSLVMHLTHPVHTSNLRAPQHPAAHFKKFLNKAGADSKKDGDSWNNTDVVPGEPVPPGMEDSIETCHIQEAFDNYKGPLIGLEYIVELVNLEDKSEPRYICLLCEKRGDPRSVMVHVTSQNHFLKYICCFFRTVGNILNLTKVNAENKRGYSIAVRKVGAEIEKHYGRLKPTSAAAETFAQKKYEILRAIDEKEHFRETPTTTFEHLVTPETIAKFNDEEEDENLKPITRPMEELQTHSSLGAIEKQKSMDKANDKKFPYGVRTDAKGKDIKRNGSANKEDPDVVIIEDDGLSPPSSRERSRRSRERSQDRGRRRGSPVGGRRRSRSRSRSRSRRGSPRRTLDKRRDYSPDRRRGFSPDRRRNSPDRRNRDRRDLSPDRRTREYEDRRTRESSPGRGIREYEDRRRRDAADRDRYDRRMMDSRDRSPYDSRRKSPRRRTPERHTSLDRSSRRPDEKKRDKYDDYRSELRKLEVELEDKLKQYESRPEKHPLYNEEWKAFWNKRYKEVQQQGRDPNTYDFKPEWIVYWGKRMKEINDEEFRLKHEDLKRLMNVDQPKRIAVTDLLGGASPVSSEDEREPVTVEDIKNTWKGLTGADLSGPPVKKRTPSPKITPWAESVPIGVKEEPAVIAPPQRQYEVAPPVVHCLRLLSVLEGYLGSLGPRAIDLLSRALSLERSGIRKSMALLEQPDVHVFFDTVKEKIRGALMAYIVEKHLVNTCRMSINVIEKMLRAHPPKENPSTSMDLFRTVSNPVAAPVVVPGIGMVEKMAVAQQIAGALIAQGRTDVSQEELEALINAVVGIAQASNASFSSSTSSVNFFSQLNMKTSTADAHINKLLSSMIQGVTGKSDPPEPSLQTKPEETKPEKDTEGEELKEKLSKFNSLSREEQQSLIAILKDLEKTDPKKVETLRKYVTVGSVVKKDETISEPAVPVNENVDSLSNDDSKKTPEKRPLVAKSDDEDDDDDDYSFEDVYKAASEKLNTNKKLPSQKSVEHNSDSNVSRASSANPLPTVSEKSKLSDFSNVFGPQRNPAEKPMQSTGNAFTFNPKNAAPEVTDPNSQMSIDEDVMITNSTSSYLPKPTPPPSIPGLGSADNAVKAAPGYGSNTIDYGFTVNPENSQSSYQSGQMYNDGQMGSYGGADRFRGNNEQNDFGRGPPFGGSNQGYNNGPGANAPYGNTASGPFGGSTGPGPFGGSSGPGGPYGGNSGPGGPYGGNSGPGGPFGSGSGSGGQFGANRGSGAQPGGTGALGGSIEPGGSFGGNSGPGGAYGGSTSYGSRGPFGGSNFGDSQRDNFAPGGPSRGGPGQFNPSSYSGNRPNFNQRPGLQGNNPPDGRKYFPDNSNRYFPR